MRRAELEWLRRTIAELKDGSLEWPQMLAQERPMGCDSPEAARPRSGAYAATRRAP